MIRVWMGKVPMTDSIISVVNGEAILVSFSRSDLHA